MGKSGAKDEVRNEVLFHSPSLPSPLTSLFNFKIKGSIWGTSVIFHFLTKCFIDQGSCFAVHTELGCFWLELYFDGMCSLKNHPCWCLSAVLSQEHPAFMNISGTRSAGPSSVWLSWLQPSCPCSALVPLGQDGEGGQSQTRPWMCQGLASVHRGRVAKGGIGIGMSGCCACQGAWAGGTVLLHYCSLWKKNFFFEKYCAVKSTKRAEEWSFLNQIIFNDNADTSDCFRSGTKDGMASYGMGNTSYGMGNIITWYFPCHSRVYGISQHHMGNAINYSAMPK